MAARYTCEKQGEAWRGPDGALLNITDMGRLLKSYGRPENHPHLRMASAGSYLEVGEGSLYWHFRGFG